MPTRLARRIAAPLLVLGGAALFGVGAGGLPRVDAHVAAATPAGAQPQLVRVVEHHHAGCDHGAAPRQEY